MHLEATVAAQKETIERKDAEIKRLKKALRTLLNSDDENSGDASVKEGDDSDTLSAAGGEEDYESDGLPEPIYLDGSYHCTECGWEIVDGACSRCNLEHEYTSEHEVKDGNYCAPFDVNMAIHWDRSLAPRGHTPLLNGPFLMSSEHGSDVEEDGSAEVNKKYQEYSPLLARGATVEMCERYQLEFTYEGGIYAWADEGLMDEFSGAAMKPGDHWKIHLGRQITLGPDDCDGEEFIENLLEDAVLFPLRSDLSRRKYERWQTTEEEPGVWVTRLMADRENENNDTDSESEEECIDYKLETEAVMERDDTALEPDTPAIPEGPIRANTYIEAEYEGEDELESNYGDDEVNDGNDVDVFLRDGPDTAWDSDDSSYFDPESSPSDSGDEEPVMDVGYLEELARRIIALTVAQQEREALADESD